MPLAIGACMLYIDRHAHGRYRHPKELDASGRRAPAKTLSPIFSGEAARRIPGKIAVRHIGESTYAEDQERPSVGSLPGGEGKHQREAGGIYCGVRRRRRIDPDQYDQARRAHLLGAAHPSLELSRRYSARIAEGMGHRNRYIVATKGERPARVQLEDLFRAVVVVSSNHPTISASEGKTRGGCFGIPRANLPTWTPSVAGATCRTETACDNDAYVEFRNGSHSITGKVGCAIAWKEVP